MPASVRSTVYPHSSSCITSILNLTVCLFLEPLNAMLIPTLDFHTSARYLRSHRPSQFKFRITLIKHVRGTVSDGIPHLEHALLTSLLYPLQLVVLALFVSPTSDPPKSLDQQGPAIIVVPIVVPSPLPLRVSLFRSTIDPSTSFDHP